MDVGTGAAATCVFVRHGPLLLSTVAALAAVSLFPCPTGGREEEGDDADREEEAACGGEGGMNNAAKAAAAPLLLVVSGGGLAGNDGGGGDGLLWTTTSKAVDEKKGKEKVGKLLKNDDSPLKGPFQKVYSNGQHLRPRGRIHDIYILR